MNKEHGEWHPIKRVYGKPELSDYRPLLQSFYGKGLYGPAIFIQMDDSGFDGDSRLLFYDWSDDTWGILIFGWGSCTACDALQGCDTMEDIEELRERLWNEIRWGSATETLLYLKGHDWEGDWCYSLLTSMFVAAAIAMLEYRLLNQDEHMY